MVRAIGREICDDDLLDLSLGEAHYGPTASRRKTCWPKRTGERSKATQIAKLGLALNATGDITAMSAKRILVH